MQRLRALKPLLWDNKSVFGQVTDHWQRIEVQNRGALHIMLIIDECSMMPASLLETAHKLCCFATKDSEKNNKLLFAGKCVYLEMFELPAVDNPVTSKPFMETFPNGITQRKL